MDTKFCVHLKDRGSLNLGPLPMSDFRSYFSTISTSPVIYYYITIETYMYVMAKITQMQECLYKLNTSKKLEKDVFTYHCALFQNELKIYM
jgi:hypothetical protein